MRIATKGTPLSEDGSFEGIVNAGTAKHRRRAQCQAKNSLWKMLLLAVAELINLLLWALGAVTTVPSILVSEVITCVMSFLAGRIWEALRR